MAVLGDATLVQSVSEETAGGASPDSQQHENEPLRLDLTIGAVNPVVGAGFKDGLPGVDIDAGCRKWTCPIKC
jgi:hypothetical protein